MVFLLMLDIALDRPKLRLADGEHAIAILPRERGKVGKSVLEPVRRSAFKELHSLGNRKSRRDGDEQMDVIGSTADAQGLRFVFPRNAAKKRPPACAHFFAQPRLASLRAEDNVVIEG